jgi:hypothetical protein
MRWAVLVLVGLLVGCGTVRTQDLAAWEGQPVSKLDTHPFFFTLPVEVRQLGDGVEIRNYVNGRNVGTCFQNARATAFSPYTVTATGLNFCSQSFMACNNIFLIRDGRVERYTPVGSGGARCMTDERVTPDGWIGRSWNF